ncbi:TMEM175 family protein [Leifsonia sp. NPDC058230]|uniref:TMEM175 family protein n=1 Tax=Leifsonia sp. NPDC058230 TaxID=3346391 RepID=UPI0036DAF3CD
MTRGRLEAFSDSVLAVAITLLVLDLNVNPGSPQSLAAQLVTEWPSFAAYLVSFLVIGLIWVNHHEVVQLADHVDRLLLFYNLLLLMWVTSLPFTTATLSGYLAHGDAQDVRIAVLLYGASMTGMAVGFCLLFVRVSRPESTKAKKWSAARITSVARFGAGIVLYPVVTLVGLFNAPLMLGIYGAVAIYYMFNQTGAVGRRQRPDH